MLISGFRGSTLRALGRSFARPVLSAALVMVVFALASCGKKGPPLPPLPDDPPAASLTEGAITVPAPEAP